jgi:hypothetical protein
MTDLWAACWEGLHPAPLGGELLRIVESQQQVATLNRVDDLAEQALLEALIERSKPPLPAGTERLHYLLATPFRYPPLRHGSRFGRRFEPALLYGSRRLPTLLAEAAYYRFVFWTAMAEPPPAGRLITQHHLFRARLRTERGLRLQNPPCQTYEAALRDPADYQATQDLGSALRAADIAAFEFVSARDPERGLNVALISPAAVASRTPLGLTHWLCETTAKEVRFSSPDAPRLHCFERATFEIDGRLPRPAD